MRAWWLMVLRASGARRCALAIPTSIQGFPGLGDLVPQRQNLSKKKKCIFHLFSCCLQESSDQFHIGTIQPPTLVTQDHGTSAIEPGVCCMYAWAQSSSHLTLGPRSFLSC